MTPSVEDAARANFSARAKHYVTSDTHSDPQRLARIVTMAQPAPGWRMLDVGTGTGHTAFAFAPAVAWVVGVDLTAEMLKQAERVRKDRGYGNVEFRVADVHDLPFPAGEFDVVTCRRAAHHFSDIRRALAETRRVLTPRGRLVIDDRSSPDDDESDGILHALDTLHDRSHVRQYRESEWLDLMRDAGLDVVSVERYQSSRPLTAFTKDVGTDEVREIHTIIANLSSRQREALGVRRVDGETYMNHFYITVVADVR